MKIEDTTKRLTTINNMAYGAVCEFDGQVCIVTDDRREHIHMLVNLRTGKMVSAPIKGEVYIETAKVVLYNDNEES